MFKRYNQKTNFVILLFLTSTILLLVGSLSLAPSYYYSVYASTGGDDNNKNNNAANSSLNVQDIPIKKVHVGDIDIAYKVFGKGDPILLLSGSGSVMDTWSPTILNDLSSNHTVIIFDHRGVGNTTTGTKPFSIIQFANDTAGLLDALKIQKADIFGYSMGTFVAQELTVMHPQKVTGLYLLLEHAVEKKVYQKAQKLQKLQLILHITVHRM